MHETVVHLDKLNCVKGHENRELEGHHLPTPPSESVALWRVKFNNQIVRVRGGVIGIATPRETPVG